jgi:hypothetical protein
LPSRKVEIDYDESEKALRHANDQASSGATDADWVSKVEALSQLCEEAGIRTHIAILGTSALAKAVCKGVDLFALKPNHAKDNPRAYSARGLSEKVLVPISAELGIHIGVTGRQPLNNQPYFRMTHLDDETPVRGSSRQAFAFTKDLIREIQDDPSTTTAKRALAAFVLVRKRYQPKYSGPLGSVVIRPDHLAECIARFVTENSEYGRRAQAIVAGMLDVFAGPQNVVSGRINDPSRHHPGDVCVLGDVDLQESWQ